MMLATALAFSALHFDFNPDSFLTRALMGVGFAYMTLRLGGIEFSTAVHATNNILIILFVAPLSLQLPEQGTGITAESLIVDLAMIVGYLAITELVARSPRLRRWAGVRSSELSPSPALDPIGGIILAFRLGRRSGRPLGTNLRLGPSCLVDLFGGRLRAR